MRNSGITSWFCPMQLGAFMRNSGITSWFCPMQLGAFMRNSGITLWPSLVQPGQLDFPELAKSAIPNLLFQLPNRGGGYSKQEGGGTASKKGGYG